MFAFDWLPSPIASALQKLLKKLKAKFVIGFVPVALAVMTVVLGAIGWSRKLFDGSLHSIVLITLNTLADFSPSIKTLGVGNDVTDLAALFGVLALYSSAAVIAANILRETWRKQIARFSHGHVLIIGDTKLAERAERVWQRQKRRPLQIVAKTADRPDWGSRYVRNDLDDNLLTAVSMAKARHVFLDLGEDGLTLALAYRLMSKMAAKASDEPAPVGDREWVVVGRDIDMADHFIAKVRALRSADGPALPRLHFLDPARLEARCFVADEPLFLEAEKRSRRCIHLLIVGFSPIAWHLVELTYLSGLTAALDPPRVTILTPQPDVERRRFFSGRAALAGAVDIAFLAFDALDDFQTGETEPGRQFRARDAAAPVTTILSVLDETDQNIAIAMRIDAIQRRTGRLGCPIFSRDEDTGHDAFLSSGGRFDQIIGGLSTFGLADAFLENELCDVDRRDALPRALHARYVATHASPGSIAGWDDLSETLRRANRNAAAHWQAKMHMLGFDIDDLPSGVLPRLSDADAHSLAAAVSDPAGGPDDEALRQLVRCEHERWMIERQIDGWTLGEVRDDHCQTNPFIVPWDVLVDRYPREIVNDQEQVRALILCLQDAGDPNVALARKIQSKDGCETGRSG